MQAALRRQHPVRRPVGRAPAGAQALIVDRGA
jgi:hypothetical protein